MPPTSLYIDFLRHFPLPFRSIFKSTQPTFTEHSPRKRNNFPDLSTTSTTIYIYLNIFLFFFSIFNLQYTSNIQRATTNESSSSPKFSKTDRFRNDRDSKMGSKNRFLFFPFFSNSKQEMTGSRIDLGRGIERMICQRGRGRTIRSSKRFTRLFLSFKTIHWIFSLLSTISRGYFDLEKIFFLDASCLFLKLRIEDNSLPFSSRRCGFSVCLQEIDSRKTIISKIGGRREIWFLFFFFFLRFACAKSFGKWFFERENGEGGRGEAREIGGERWYLTGKIEFSNLRWIENIYNIYF